ncbi:phosphatidylinositol glycan-class A [Methanolobus psychrophilus R15]|nr:phosphatidylinositol glycan-class A [Methanolobus psychrophilus R15]
MNICVITSAKFPPEEGIGNYIYNMSQQFIRKGHKVTVITRGGIHRTQKEEFHGIELYRVPFVLAYPIHVHIHGLFLRKLLKSIEQKFDVVHVHTPLPPLINSKLPSLLTFHSPMLKGAEVIKIQDLFSLATNFQAKFISYPLEKRLIEKSNLVTAVSKRVADELEDYGLKVNEIHITSNGVDETVFLPAYRSKVNRKYVLYTGRISYGKGLSELIECAKNICDSRDDIDFILAGDGPLLEELQKKVTNSGLQERIRFLGRVSRQNIVELYRNATIFAFPSYYEGLPGSLLEAMSCELSIVATEVPGNIDLIDHNVNGILVPSKDSVALADSILVLLEQEELCEKLGKEARKKVMQEFTWNAISDNILNCYESTIIKGQVA